MEIWPPRLSYVLAIANTDGRCQNHKAIILRQSRPIKLIGIGKTDGLDVIQTTQHRADFFCRYTCFRHTVTDHIRADNKAYSTSPCRSNGLSNGRQATFPCGRHENTISHFRLIGSGLTWIRIRQLTHPRKTRQHSLFRDLTTRDDFSDGM